MAEEFDVFSSTILEQEQTQEAVPSDEFEIFSEPSKKVYVEDRKQSYEFPVTYDEVEMDFSIQTEIDNKERSGFFGMVDYGVEKSLDFSKGFGRGFTGFIASLPQVPGVLLKERGLVLQETKDPGNILPFFFIPGTIQKAKFELAKRTKFDERLIASGQKRENRRRSESNLVCCWDIGNWH